MLSLAARAVPRVGFRSLATAAPLDAAKLEVFPAATKKEKLPPQDLVFGTTFTDHMFEVDWQEGVGWGTPTISPHHPLTLDPASSCLHYALQCFEGMKAYVDEDDRARLFRPDRNMDRMFSSMERLTMPTFEKDSFLECIKQLVLLDKEWIPRHPGYSLYIRPTAIATTPYLGVGPATMCKMFVIMSPVGPYYKEGFSAVSLYADSENVRAWPGGTGNAKVGGNYGPTIRPQIDAANRGYSQVLWLYGPEHYVTEVGTMNMFTFWVNKDGEKELVTAPLSDGTILPGVTRQSIMELCKEWGEFKVTERMHTMKEIADAADEGRLLECFGAGTAAIVSPIMRIGYDGKDYDIPLDPDNPDGQAGKLTQRLHDTLTDIQYGRLEHEWSVLLD